MYDFRLYFFTGMQNKEFLRPQIFGLKKFLNSHAPSEICNSCEFPNVLAALNWDVMSCHVWWFNIVPCCSWKDVHVYEPEILSMWEVQNNWHQFFTVPFNAAIMNHLSLLHFSWANSCYSPPLPSHSLITPASLNAFSILVKSRCQVPRIKTFTSTCANDA